MKLPPPWPYPGPPPGVYPPLRGERHSYAGIEIQVHGQDFKAFRMIDAPARK